MDADQNELRKCINMNELSKIPSLKPESLQALLLEFTMACLLEQPTDTLDYAVEFFAKLQTNRQTTRIITETPISEDRTLSEEEEQYENQRNKPRRNAISAESFNPANDPNDEDYVPIIFPKTDEQRQRLFNSVKTNLLFRSLNEDQMKQVLDAMFERTLTPNEVVIRQGDDGDYFYVIESGIFNVYVGDQHIHTYKNSGSFGELALLYNQHRLATIIAETQGKIWAMSRLVFRRIILKSAFKRHLTYERLLKTIPMIRTLEKHERMNLADALVTRNFDAGEVIFIKGDEPDGMYFVEKGSVSLRYQREEGDVEIATIGKSGYFGELELISRQNRIMSAYAIKPVLCAFLPIESFQSILGPCIDIIKKHFTDYESTIARLFGNDEVIHFK